MPSFFCKKSGNERRKRKAETKSGTKKQKEPINGRCDTFACGFFVQPSRVFDLLFFFLRGLRRSVLILFHGLLAFLLREVKSGLAPLVPLIAGVMLLLGTLVRLSPLTALFEMLSQAGLDESVSLSLRVLGIGYLGELGADMCRDLGAGSLGARLEMCAGIEILLVSLPCLESLLSKAMELLS